MPKKKEIFIHTAFDFNNLMTFVIVLSEVI